MATLRVTASSLNVRQVPSVDGAIVGTVSRDDEVEQLELSADQQWARIQKNGLSGWASRKFLAEEGQKTLSGSFWVEWANKHVPGSHSTDDLVEPFRGEVRAFIHALQDAGAKVAISATLRPPERAYLFHYSWLIGLGRIGASEADPMEGVDIEWDHGNDASSRAAAMEMVDGFGLSVPPDNEEAPALASLHTRGQAIDMDIDWAGTLHVKMKDGTVADVPFLQSVNKNVALHAVGASYGVKKLLTDAPHWSATGH